jgi:hypothetical protein
MFFAPPALKSTLATAFCSRVSRLWFVTFGSVILALSSAYAVKPVDSVAPIHRAEKPIKDEQGRIEMIIDFDFGDC